MSTEKNAINGKPMMTLPINDALILTLYDSIKEFPASLQLEAKLYTIQRSGLASTPEELESRKKHMDVLLAYNQQENYQVEEYNYRHSIRLMALGYNPAELAWACHVCAINGEPLKDYSEDVLMDRVELLKKQGLTPEQISSSLESVNEQMLAETKRYYPARVAKGNLNNLQRLVTYGLALADHTELNTDKTKVQLDKATVAMLSMQKPPNLTDSPASILVMLELSQFNLYATIQMESGAVDVEKLTVFQFYGWLRILEERNEQQAAALTNMKKR